jgi:biotin synthase
MKEAETLFEVPLFSDEAGFILSAGRRKSEQASGGVAEVHAQVGLNVGACPKNCLFCAFAAINGIFNEMRMLPIEEVVERAVAFETQGANAIYLMETASHSFDRFLEVGREARRALKAGTPLVANTGDLDPHQAMALLEAGFNGIYHAERLGEGRDTTLDPKKRRETMEIGRETGLIVGTCVEPVGPEHTAAELAEKTFTAVAALPVFSGAARRIAIPGTPVATRGMTDKARMALVIAVVRLLTPLSVPGNCTHEPDGIGAFAGANLLWAEAGSNPRDTSEKTEKERGMSVGECRTILEEAGWKVLQGPSRFFRS